MTLSQNLMNMAGAGELVEEGCWWRARPVRFDGRAALFLDRDGVIVREIGYLGRAADVVLEASAAATIAAFNRAAVPVVVVTNQSGVARGYFGWDDVQAVQAEIDHRLGAEGAHVDAVFACGYHADGRGRLAVRDHPWRKPRPGMFLAAADRLGLDLSRSAVVGDRAQDLAAGRSAGLAWGVQVATGHGGPDEQASAAALRRPAFAVRLAADMGGALDLLGRLSEA